LKQSASNISFEMKQYFAFSGPIGSGKSSVSKLFASTMGAGWAGFGSTIKEIALERHLPINRQELQRLGAELVEKERASFCGQVIAKGSNEQKPLAVIDGLRHLSVLEELRRLVGRERLLCIYVDAPQASRLERVRSRDGLSSEELADLEKHSTEIEVKNRLKEIADFIATNSGPVEDCVHTIVNWAELKMKAAQK
jgi:dephospho-CoA kinase